ncbi:acyl-coenzyme A thioesterase 11-like [Xenia sp. Carnegie-2017]|uniref:acyl-coenzyme A thioesterase 11-like n=1 Tax=Xenia sp. Carnegie-2017 TaxID=2897299 RepID=UPI001F04B515|nr:acyl-coenzyme A thioesterase 11-like [Xenia sp. Carnegie-2017]
MATEYRNPTEIIVNHIISSADIQKRNQALFAGDLLKTMDITACISAERHAKLPCVTLMMDDLVVSKDLYKGQVVNVTAKLTRAFGSSMEVVVDVHLKDMFTDEDVQVCQAYFVFVALAKVGKAKLTHLDPVTYDERLEYALAYERRRLRYAARNAAKAKSAKKNADSSTVANFDAISPGEVTMKDTAVESTELVAPNDANHHQTTFGGQIMAWLVSLCTISATKLCKKSPTIVELDGVHFLAKSVVGDRLLFKAMVNKTFDDKTFEVGCRVESRSLEGNIAHINSAYITFALLDEKKQPLDVPVVKATTADELKRQGNAVIRRQNKIAKEKILGKTGPALTVPWTQKASDMLAFHNVSAVKRMYHMSFTEIQKICDCEVSSHKQDHITCFKVETSIGKPAADVFKAVQLETRACWDIIISQSKLAQKIDEDDNLYYVILASSFDGDKSSSKPGDYVVMESFRPAVEKDVYVVAYRSVSLESYPESDQYKRQADLSSGFVISQSASDPNQSTLTFVFQVTNEAAALILPNIQKNIQFFSQRMQKLREYLKV